MRYICQRRHACNNRCDAMLYKHHDIVLGVNDERLLEDEIDSIKAHTFAKDVTCHDIIKETRNSTMFLAATLSPITICRCIGPCMNDPWIESSEA